MRTVSAFPLPPARLRAVLNRTLLRLPADACDRTRRLGLGVQPNELVPLVLLGAGGAPDLAARRCGNRPRRYQNEITDIQTVRIGYRGGDIAFDFTEPARRVLVSVLALLELDDGDQLLGTVHRNRNRRDPAACDLLVR